jgi:hypothetical protein
MENREELLDRLVRALARPGVDGVLGSAEVLTDLLLLGALEDKVVLGTMNRGGLLGAVFEYDDRFTAFDVATLHRLRFEGCKMLLRIDLSDPATVRTLEHGSAAITRLAEAGLVAIVEPFLAGRRDGRPVNDLSPAAVDSWSWSLRPAGRYRCPPATPRCWFCRCPARCRSVRSSSVDGPTACRPVGLRVPAVGHPDGARRAGRGPGGAAVRDHGNRVARPLLPGGGRAGGATRGRCLRPYRGQCLYAEVCRDDPAHAWVRGTWGDAAL